MEQGIATPALLFSEAFPVSLEEGGVHLVSLEVKGLKSLRDTKIDGLEQYNVFIGKNDSGKSTVLQAIGLLGSVETGLQPERMREIIAEKPPAGSISLTCDFVLSRQELANLPGLQDWRDSADLDTLRRWRYEFEMRVGDERWHVPQFYLLECSLVRGEERAPLLRVAEREAPESGFRSLEPAHLTPLLREAPTVSMESVLAAPWAEKSTVTTSAPIRVGTRYSPEPVCVTLLREFIAGMRSLDATRQAVDEQGVSETLTLERSGGNLTRVLDTLHANHIRQFEMIVDLTGRLFPTVAGVYLTRRKDLAVLRVSSGLGREPLEAFRVSEVGTGIQQVLMLAAGVVSAPEGGVVLLEEPENNLHPGAQCALGMWLRDQAVERDKQVLITTHSTIFAVGDQNCSTYLVRLDEKEGTKVTKLQAGYEAAVKEELGLRNVDLYGCSMVVLCEGDSEMVAMPIILDALARKAGHALPTLGLAWRNLGGSGNSRVRWVEEFLRLLKDIDVRPYILVDDDPDAAEGLQRLVRAGTLGGDEYHLWRLDKAQFDRNASVSSEFEDNWTNEQLVDVAGQMAREDGIELDLHAARFAKLCRESEKRTSKVLEDYCWTEKSYDLDKKELNRRLALGFREELGGAGARTVGGYDFERAASAILERIWLSDGGS